MTEPQWVRTLPSSPVSELPPCDDDDAYEVRDLYVADAAHLDAVVLERPELVNSRLTRCDVAGVVARDGRASRIVVEHGRLRGVTWMNGLVQDAVIDTVLGEEVSFRFTTLRRVVFRDCRLPELDLTEATLDDVRFERCGLRAARFHNAKVAKLRIEGCDLAGFSGAEALRGASLHPDDLAALAPSLATALDITLE